MTKRQTDVESLTDQISSLRDHRKNLRRGPSFNMRDQGDFSDKVKFRDFDLEEEQLLEKKIDLRIRLESLVREQRRLNESHLHPSSGTRLDVFYPTLPAPGALLRFDPENKMSGCWEHPHGSGNRGFRNLAQDVQSYRTHEGKTSWALNMSARFLPAIMVPGDAISTLLPCEPVLIGDHTPYVKIMVNSIRRDSEILWAPVSDLVLV